MSDHETTGPADSPVRGRVGPGQFVRPKGYAGEDPVVRRIGDRDCFIGNAPAAHPDVHDTPPKYVLSATAERRPLTTHHHPLTDGPGNEWHRFEAAVDATRRLYRREGSVLVHCKAGVSRSATLLATAIAAEEGRTFLDSLAEVQEARPHAIPNPALHELGVVYLATLE